jgi:hypothetical protein
MIIIRVKNYENIKIIIKKVRVMHNCNVSEIYSLIKWCQKELKNIVVKYLTNQATAFELDELERWIEDPRMKKYLKPMLRLTTQLNII